MKTQLKILILLMGILSFLPNWKLNAQQTEFYGMTNEGGTNGAGTIFKTDGNGNNYQVIENFGSPFVEMGRCPVGKLCEAHNGKFYGMTTYGGTSSYGTLYEWDPETNIYTEIFEFDGTETGSNPHGSLLLATNGKLYGTTINGGNNGDGVLFEWDPTTYIYAKKIDFIRYKYGRWPIGTLMQANNGKFYGMTCSGGEKDQGVLFEWDPIENIYSVRYNFDGKISSQMHDEWLIQAEDGKLYGMTESGGANDLGIIFEWDPVNNIFTKKLDFDLETGGNPLGSFIQATNGKLYGATRNGGANDLDCGVLFEWDPLANTFTKKYDFNYLNGFVENGGCPLSSLVQVDSNKILGVALGGIHGSGVLFEFDLTSGIYSKKFVFNSLENGSDPNPLMLSTNGKIYFTTELGRASEGDIQFEGGAIFEYNPLESTCAKKFAFSQADNGIKPMGSLIQASNKKLYGMTSAGGANGNGVLFEYDPWNEIYVDEVDFYWANKGSDPFGSLIQGIDGKFYGLTSQGGEYDGTGYISEVCHGVLFEYDPATSNYSIKIKFNGINGDSPVGSLIQTKNQKLYGMTTDGGTYNLGVLFEYDPVTNLFSKIIDLNGESFGANPKGSLLLSVSGKLYGMTSYGGTYNNGVLFEFDPITNIFSKIFDFNGALNGRMPLGSLIQATNGSFYGMTNKGGLYDKGILFEWNPDSNVILKKLDFNGIVNGSEPYGSLLQAENGKLYGMTSKGGLYDEGVLYEWDPITNLYVKKYDFNGSDGIFPHGSLIEIKSVTSSDIKGDDVNPVNIQDIHLKNSTIYPNPNYGSFTIDLGKVYSNADITIITPEGQIIQEENRKDLRTFDIQSAITPGIYFVKIATEEKTNVVKIVKK